LGWLINFIELYCIPALNKENGGKGKIRNVKNIRKKKNKKQSLVMLEIVQKNMSQLVGKTVIQCLYKEVSLDYSNRVSKNIFFCFVIKIGAMFPFFCRKVADRNVYEVRNLGASYE